MSRLVSQMTSTVETLAVSRLDLVLGLSQSRLLKPTDVEGWPSGTSQQLALAELSGIERLCTGGDGGTGTGLAELVRVVAPAVELRLKRRVGDAMSAVRKLSAPAGDVRRPRLISRIAKARLPTRVSAPGG